MINLHLVGPGIPGRTGLAQSSTDSNVCIHYALPDQCPRGAGSWFSMTYTWLPRQSWAHISLTPSWVGKQYLAAGRSKWAVMRKRSWAALFGWHGPMYHPVLTFYQRTRTPRRHPEECPNHTVSARINGILCSRWQAPVPDDRPIHQRKGLVAPSNGGLLWAIVWKRTHTYQFFNVPVNGEWYRHMLNKFLFPNMQELNIDISWFQQNGAMCYTSTVTINLLKGQFRDGIIKRNGSVNRPPRSCDLTPPGYFHPGYVKPIVFADKPTTLEALKVNINSAINEIEARNIGISGQKLDWSDTLCKD